jgi:hypothetical protein
MLDKIEFYHKIWAKIKFLRLTMMYLWIRLRKNLKKIIFLHPLKSLKKGVGSGVGSGSGSISQRYGSGDSDPHPDPEPHQNVTDPQYWFRSKKIETAYWCRSSFTLHIFTYTVSHPPQLHRQPFSFRWSTVDVHTSDLHPPETDWEVEAGALASTILCISQPTTNLKLSERSRLALSLQPSSVSLNLQPTCN